MIDLDHFKAINDTYGHSAGDSVLVEVSTIFADLCRSSDRIGRYGGEEFLIVLPETKIDEAKELAERIRIGLMEHQFCQSQSLELKVTCSIGVAQLKPDQSQSELLQIADEALYKAKSMGRNKVALADY
jgi:diguanylate cyclase (GGDEF)-like protein